jgi:signal peptidase I
MWWRLENYLKYLIALGVIFAVLWGHSNYGCTSMTSIQMDPLMKKDEYFVYYPRERDPGKYERGSAMVFFGHYYNNLRNPTEEFVCRVIALPGDRIRMENGVVYVNGEAQAETYITEERRTRDDMPEIIVPREHLFVLSDARQFSDCDSRGFGPISRHAIFGRVRPPH